MLGNCNCVEGLPFVCVNRTSCSVDECGLAVGERGNCNQDICPGWMVSDSGDGTPEVFAPNLIYKCEESPGARNGYSDSPSCNRVATTEGESQYYDVFMDNPSASVTTLSKCPNPPYSPPTPPPPIPQTIVCENGSCNQYPTSEAAGKTGNKINCLEVFGKIDCDYAKADCEKNCNTPPPPKPPAPPTPSVCTYSGDSNVGGTPTSFDEQWWKDSEDRCGTCDTDIANCREDMKNYLKYVDGVDLDKTPEKYNGFCLQTIGTLTKGRGDCGRTELTTDKLYKGKSCDTKKDSNVCIDDKEKTIYIADPANVKDGAKTCKSYRGGDTFANMAWVQDSLDSPCNANCPGEGECPTTTLRTGIPI